MEKCYICNSDKTQIFKKVNNILVYKCNECGLFWVGERDKIELNYNQDYFNSNSKMGYKNYFADEINHRRNAKYILRTVDKIKDLNNTKILDIGCAFGFFLDEARKLKNCDVYGIELSNYAAEYASKKLNIKVFNKELNSSSFDTNFFDAIFLIGTIEHLVSPKKLLSNIRRILKEEGILIITTINTSGLIPLFSIKPPEHLFYFNHNNLAKMLADSGYKIKLNKLYFVNYLLYDLFYRLSKFLSFTLPDYLFSFIKKITNNISVKIPTNEMFVVAKKSIS